MPKSKLLKTTIVCKHCGHRAKLHEQYKMYICKQCVRGLYSKDIEERRMQFWMKAFYNIE
jgi:hypothetical protein